MRIVIAGDFVPIGRVAEKVNNGDYSCFSQIKPVIEDSDYAIVNFECPVVTSSAKPITKVGPALKCSEKSIEALSWAGFKGVTLANNHFRDYGEVGVEDTISALKRNGIDYVGGGTDDEEASRILYKSIGDETIAVINCCEHEFSVATETHGGSNPLNPVKQYESIVKAKEKANYVIVIVHGGHENYQLPSPRMQETYRFFINVGADAVVNHHQHCYSGYEIYKNKPIIYGQGNFCFDQLFSRTPTTWFEGYMVLLDFSDKDVVFELIPYTQCKDGPSVELSDYELFKNKIAELNDIIYSPKKLQESFLRLSDNRGKEALVNVLAPSGNRHVLGLIKRHLLPSFITKEKVLKALSYVNCESHRDILLTTMKKTIKKEKE